ncbi:MAG: ankyrin repeat domain-containing protein [Opitutaceae bacterium]|nr:ankyrin repeat domain-containing protein [Opitutaceae bacterium]
MKSCLNSFYLVGLAVMLSACTMAPGFTRTPKAEEFFLDPKVRTLVQAAARGDTRRVDALLHEGVDINARGKGGMTPVLFAMARLNKTGYRHLLERGANPNLIVDPGESVMSFASRIKDSEWLRLALRHGGDPNLIGARNIPPPLHESILYRRPENMRLLLDAGADINIRDGTGGTPMITAENIGSYEIVYEFLQRGADYRIKTKAGADLAKYISLSQMTPDNPKWPIREKVIAWLAERGVQIPPLQ